VGFSSRTLFYSLSLYPFFFLCSAYFIAILCGIILPILLVILARTTLEIDGIAFLVPASDCNRLMELVGLALAPIGFPSNPSYSLSIHDQLRN
jgi:hypothetical protein